MSHRRSPPSPRPPLSLALTSASSSGHSNWTHPSPSAHSFSAWVEREGEEPHPRCGSSCARSPRCPARSYPRPYRGTLFRASPLYSSTERSDGWSRRASTGFPTVCSITRPWPRLQARASSRLPSSKVAYSTSPFFTELQQKTSEYCSDTCFRLVTSSRPRQAGS